MSKAIVKFIVSEGIETQSNNFQQRQVVVNPVLVFETQFIPTSLSLAISMIVKGISDGGTHSFSFGITNNVVKKEIFNSGAANLEVLKNQENFIISADLKNIGFENEGSYTVTLSIDGEEYSDEFFVKGMKAE